MREKAPIKSTAPTSERSGKPPKELGMVGTARFQPVGLGLPSTTEGPAPVAASMIMPKTVVSTMPMNNPPRTCLATRMPHIIKPTTNTKVGQDAMDPLMPSPTGTVVPAASGIRRTKPASTRPIMAMNRPIPTPMAALSSRGMALNTATRNPEIARSTMMMPSMTTSPMASGQVNPSPDTKVTATSVLMPRPVAMPKG